MRNMMDPRRNKLLDSYRAVLSPVAYARMIKEWQGASRHVILQEIPANKLAEHFIPNQGRPTESNSTLPTIEKAPEVRGFSQDPY